MFNAKFGSTVVIVVGVALASSASMAQQDVKIADPTSVVMIVNRDSNDLGFMDIKTKKIIGRVFLGNNVNPHMVMMSPDGRYVVTGGTRANKAYIVDCRGLFLQVAVPLRAAVPSRHENLLVAPRSHGSEAARSALVLVVAA